MSAPAGTAPRRLRVTLAWVGVLYFAEGLPLGLYYDFLPVYLRAHGADLAAIGLLGPLSIAWTVKFLWAPLIDRVRAHRRWMLAADCAMALLLAALGTLGPPVAAVLGLCAALAWLSATNDIATDAYTIEMLAGRDLGRANGVRIALYRVGMLTAGAMLVLADAVGWTLACLVGALVLVGNGIACRLAPAEPTRPPRPAQAAGPDARPLRRALGAGLLAGGLTWLALRGVVSAGAVLAAGVLGVAAVVVAVMLVRGASGALAPMHRLIGRPGMAAVLVFALLYKAGDAAMGLMVRPFWLDAGFSLSAIGMVSVNVGLGLSILGGLVGGYLTDRWGLIRALVWLGLAQAASNLGYAYAAWVIPPGAGAQGGYTAVIYAASMIESFTGGLGTAAFLALLMAVVDRRLAATEYAILSSVFALGRALAGWGGGLGAASLGYAPFFLVSAFVGLPALVLVPWLRRALAARDTADSDAIRA